MHDTSTLVVSTFLPGSCLDTHTHEHWVHVLIDFPFLCLSWMTYFEHVFLLSIIYLIAKLQFSFNVGLWFHDFILFRL